MIILGGPTASGKSDVALELAAALDGEIISADSMQIYKGLDIGTAKISKSEMRGIPHYGIDIVDAENNFSVAEYKEYAEKVIADILSRGKLPIMVGGTGLYIRSVLYPFSFGGVEANSQFRAEMTAYAETHGRQALYQLLVEKNPSRAAEIHYNNLPRVIRALEIEEFGTGDNSDTERDKMREDCTYFCLEVDSREVLYDRINRRVDAMISRGLKNEVTELLSRGVTFDCQSMQGIGYKEWRDALEGNAGFYETIELIKKNSRNYAKRQETWFKREPCIYVRSDSDPCKTAANILNIYKNRGNL